MIDHRPEIDSESIAGGGLIDAVYHACTTYPPKRISDLIFDTFENRNAPSLEEAGEAILSEYVRRIFSEHPALTDGTGRARMYDLVEIGQSLGFGSIDLIQAAAASLESNHLLTMDSPPSGFIPEPNQEFRFAYIDEGGFQKGIGLLYRALSLGRIAFGSDRIVSLDDNRPAVNEAENALAIATKAISASNTVPPDQKELILSCIEVGALLLKSRKTYVAAISALLLKPLYDAYASVIEDASKPLIQAAIETVRQLIGL